MPEPVRKYGLNFGPDTDALEIELEMIRRGGQWKDNSGRTFGLGLFHHFKAAQTLVWPEDDHHRWSNLILQEYLANRITVVCGSRDCVAGHTMIHNLETGLDTPIQELFERGIAPTVMTLFGPKKASAPFIHGAGDLYEVVLRNGSRFTCSSKHLVLSDSGFVYVGSLSLGQAIYSAFPASASSISELCPSVHAEDDQRCFEKLPNLTDGYLHGFDPYGEQLLMARGSGSKPFPLRAGVPKHTQDDCETDGLERGLKRNHPWFEFGHPSTEGYSVLESSKECTQFFPWKETHEVVQHSFQQVLQSALDYDRGLESPSKSNPDFADRHSVFGKQHQPFCQSRPRFLGTRASCLVEAQIHPQPCSSHSTYGMPRPSRLSLIQRFFSFSQYTVVETVVQSIKRVGSGNFYDITVPESGHYFAEGAIHHNSGKTRGISKAALIDYFIYPDDTLILMTSTTLQGLELRVWGDVKSLHDRALNRYPWLAGNVVDSKHGIFTDKIEEGQDVRDQRKGILCIAVLGSKGEYNGESLKNFAGIKQRRRRWIGDEMQFLPSQALKVLDSLDKGDFKAAFLGNPIAENGKALDAVSEPIGGWDSVGEITKTTTWTNKYNGVTINLVGIDSPNFDKETLNRFPYMVDQGDVDRVSKRPGGKDSLEWWSQIMGVRKAGAVSNRVLTVAEIEAAGGFKEPVWSGTPRTRIYSIDAGFGGDECVRTWLEFGKLTDGTTAIAFGDQTVIPILLSASDTAEKQIAKYAKRDCAMLGIPAANVFFDAGMYATLAIEMSREMSPDVNAVNFGGPATERPVSNDMYVFEHDEHLRRLKTWSEHVSKFVTELWFVVRLLVQCRQARNFPKAAAEEFGRRVWTYVSRDRYELETKDDYKLRNGGESPNHADSLVIACEGARRRGFTITKLGNPEATASKVDEWLETAMLRQRRIRERHQLNYAA